MRRLTRSLLLATLAASACSAPPDGPVSYESQAAKSGSMDIQILAVNDFHGNLEPPTGSNAAVTGRKDGKLVTLTTGGATFLATHIQDLRAGNPNTLFVSAGDLIGASPLVSGLFHDEPTIEAFNAMGLDYNATGNHEFDEGPAELMRMQDGGCHPVDGCQDGDEFAGASFRFLAADVWGENDHTLFPPYKVRSFGSAKVAIIGMTLHDTPAIVSPAGVAGLHFTDEADTTNDLVHYLQGQGIHAFVLLVHQGGGQTAPGTYDECNGLSGQILDIVNRLDPEVQVVLSAHTHNAYNCTIDGRILTSAASFGRLITKVDLTIDRASGRVTAASAHNLPVTRDVAEDPAVKSIVDKYKGISAAQANRVVGSITADIVRIYKDAAHTIRDDGKESPLGDVIADAQLWATADASRGGAVIAFMNPGGIRADFVYAGSPAGEGDGNVTYSETFTVQPFANVLATVTLTGQQIKDVLEQQFTSNQPSGGKLLQVSAGFTYSYSMSAPVLSKVDASSLRLNGEPLSMTGGYRVTMNNFLADGGDNFPGFKAGTDRLGGDVDVDALVAYFGASSPVAPGPTNRITVLP